MRRSICIISFSPIYQDARVLRQIKYLSPQYDLVVIGYGHPHTDFAKIPSIKWMSLDSSEGLNNRTNSLIRRNSLRQFVVNSHQGAKIIELLRFLMAKIRLVIYYLVMFLGRLNSSVYESWYWRNVRHLQALEYATSSRCDAFHANDWNALPVAAEAAGRASGQLVFDAHEYAPLELENRRFWKLLFKPVITYFIQKYSNQIKASLTVAPLISERYKKEFGLDPVILLNAPASMLIPNRELDFNNIRMIHHGGAIRDRQLEKMIKILALCDQRYSLHFMLINNGSEYLKHLKKLANELAPGRVTFLEPVLPEEVVQRISEYDMGFCLIAPTNYNYLVSLPNKFFDYIMAGLAVCIGPSPSMAELVRKYGLGCVAPSFEPQDVAKTLNQLTLDQLLMMRQASKEAAKKINAENEMGKLIELYSRLFSSEFYAQ